MIELPATLLAQARLGSAWADWIDRLPRLAAELCAEWSLIPGGDIWHGHAALALPVTDLDGVPAVLKLGFDGDDEGRHEALALQRWAGNGAVRLKRADPRRRALLLERLLPRDLTSIDTDSACRVVAGLYRSLHIPAGPPLTPVANFVARWLGELSTLPRDSPIPRRYVEQALSLGRNLIDDAATKVVVHGDLHYENVLAATRAPWLAIDPKPMAGDPEYEPAPMSWNRWSDCGTDIRPGLRTRFHTLIDAGEFDEDRAREWVIVRMIINAHWTIQDAHRRALTAAEANWITRCVAIAKAVQD